LIGFEDVFVTGALSTVKIMGLNVEVGKLEEAGVETRTPVVTSRIKVTSGSKKTGKKR